MDSAPIFLAAAMCSGLTNEPKGRFLSITVRNISLKTLRTLLSSTSMVYFPSLIPLRKGSER